MAFYETVLIARQDISAKQAEEMTATFVSVVNDNGGKVEKTESWGLRTLAYKIKKNRKGHYALIHADAPHAAIVEMERQMTLNEDVLRFQTVRIDEIPKDPSPVLKSMTDGDYSKEGGSRDRR